MRNFSSTSICCFFSTSWKGLISFDSSVLIIYISIKPNLAPSLFSCDHPVDLVKLIPDIDYHNIVTNKGRKPLKRYKWILQLKPLRLISSHIPLRRRKIFITKITLFIYIVVEKLKLLKIHLSSHYNSCECNTLIVIIGNGLEKLVEFDFETWMTCHWEVRGGSGP